MSAPHVAFNNPQRANLVVASVHCLDSPTYLRPLDTLQALCLCLFEPLFSFVPPADDCYHY